MKSTNSLLKISGNRIQLFAETVNNIRPGLQIDVDAWKRMDTDARTRKMATLFAMHGFTEEELQQIKRTVLRIEIPYKLIMVCVLAGILAFFSYKVYKFTQLPRVYAIGNDVPVSTGIDGSSQLVKRLDLFGVSDVGSSSDYCMLLTGDTSSQYMVQNDNFWEWVRGKAQNYYVSKTAVVAKKKEYADYEHLFQQAKGLQEFDQLTVDDRIAVKTCIDNNKDLFNAVVSADGSIRDGFMSFTAANGIDGQRHIFLSLKKTNNQPFNIQVICRQGIFSASKEVVSNVGKSFDAVLYWKKDDGQQFPIIYFRNSVTQEIYKSLFPPYDAFLK